LTPPASGGVQNHSHEAGQHHYQQHSRPAREQALWLHRDGPDKAVRPCDVDEEVDAQVALHPVGSQLCIRVRRLGMDEEPWNKQVGAGRGSGESGRGET